MPVMIGGRCEQTNNSQSGRGPSIQRHDVLIGAAQAGGPPVIVGYQPMVSTDLAAKQLFEAWFVLGSIRPQMRDGAN
jgi:hypothetical protein